MTSMMNLLNRITAIFKSEAEDENFVRLMVLARQDPGIRSQLLNILMQDAFQRQSALNTWIEDMRIKGAPPELISAISCLLNENLANKARDILGSS